MRRPIDRLRRAILVLLALCFVGLVSYHYGRYATEGRLRPFVARTEPELGALSERYGPARHSRYGEEWILRDYFQDRLGGVFVDVGANDYKRDSNTFYLEKALGWSGLAIDPQAKFAAAYAKHRPNTRFVPLFVSDRSNATATLFVPPNDLIASTDTRFIESQGGADPVPTEVNTTTLDDILTRAAVGTIDFLNVDVELHEPQVLAGFTIERWRPRLVCVEAHPQTRQVILDYFSDHGYRLLGRYLRMDTENLWFEARDK